MAAEVLGISGSPIPNSNTDRAVRHILEAVGRPSEFIKLSQLDLSPCQACLGCKQSNQCVVRDDGRELAEKFRAARAFVIGAYTPYSSLDARTKTFMERMYCLRHQTGLNAGKIGAAVVTCAIPPGAEGLPPAAATAQQQLTYWMMEEGMNLLGSMVLIGNVPCLRCGHGDECAVSGVKMIYGPEATVASVGVRQFEADASTLAAADDLAARIRAALDQPATAALS
jgi:multimeric flavodoxin WrbA